jgi:hypothetical protein
MAKAPVRTAYTTADLYALLRQRYRTEASIHRADRFDSVLLEHVRSATGFDADRECDAMFFDFWPSRGLKIIGFELKASRSDWLRELKDPEKSERFSHFCHSWYLVAAPGVAEPDELPVGWGLLVPNAREKLHAVRMAREATPSPMPIQFFMSILRTACTSSWAPKIEDLKAALQRDAEVRASSNLLAIRERLAKLEESVREFEEASGVKIGEGWDSPQRIGQVVRVVRTVLSRGYGGALTTVEGHGQALRRLAEECDAAAAEIRRLQESEEEAVAHG